MYNKMHITQLGTCAVVIKFKNIEKRCVFFVVPGNGQALLGMPDIAALKLININIDSIQAEMVEYKTQNKHITGNACGEGRLCKHRCRFKNQTRCQWSKWPKQC